MNAKCPIVATFKVILSCICIIAEGFLGVTNNDDSNTLMWCRAVRLWRCSYTCSTGWPHRGNARIHSAPESNPWHNACIDAAPNCLTWNDACIHAVPDCLPWNDARFHAAPDCLPWNNVCIHATTGLSPIEQWSYPSRNQVVLYGTMLVFKQPSSHDRIHATSDCLIWNNASIHSDTWLYHMKQWNSHLPLLVSLHHRIVSYGTMLVSMQQSDCLPWNNDCIHATTGLSPIEQC